MELKNSDLLTVIESVSPNTRIMAKATARYLASKTQSQREIFQVISDVMQCGLNDEAYGLAGDVVIPEYLSKANVPVFIENSEEQKTIIENFGDMVYVPFDLLLRSIHYTLFSNDDNDNESIPISLPPNWYSCSPDVFNEMVDNYNASNDKAINSFVIKHWLEGHLLYIGVDGETYPVSSDVNTQLDLNDVDVVYVDQSYLDVNSISVDIHATLEYYTQSNDDGLAIITAFECLSNGVSSITDFATKLSTYTQTTYTEILARNQDIVNAIETSRQNIDTSLSVLINKVSSQLDHDFEASIFRVDEANGWAFDNYTGEGGLHAIFNLSSWGSSFKGIFNVSVDAVRATVNVVKTGVKMLSSFVGKIWNKYAKPYVETQDITINSSYDDDYMDLPIATSLMHNNPIYFDKNEVINLFNEELSGTKTLFQAYSNDSERVEYIKDQIESINTIDDEIEIGPSLPGGVRCSSHTEGFTSNQSEASMKKVYDTGSSIVADDFLNPDITDVDYSKMKIQIRDNSNSSLIFDSHPEYEAEVDPAVSLITTRIFPLRPKYSNYTKRHLDEDANESDRTLRVALPDMFYSYESNKLDFRKSTPYQFNIHLDIFWGYNRGQSIVYGNSGIKSGSHLLRGKIYTDITQEAMLDTVDYFDGPYNRDHHDCLGIRLKPGTFHDNDNVSRPAPDNAEGDRDILVYQCFNKHLQNFSDESADSLFNSGAPFKAMRIKRDSGYGKDQSTSNVRCIDAKNNSICTDKWLTYEQFINMDICFRGYTYYAHILYSIEIEFDDGTKVLYRVKFNPASILKEGVDQDPTYISLVYVKTTHSGHNLTGYGFSQSYRYSGHVTAIPIVEIWCPTFTPCSFEDDVLQIGETTFNVSSDPSNKMLSIGSHHITFNSVDNAGTIVYDTFKGYRTEFQVMDYPFLGVDQCYNEFLFHVFFDNNGKFIQCSFVSNYKSKHVTTTNGVSYEYGFNSSVGRYYTTVSGSAELNQAQLELLNLVDSYNIMDQGSTVMFDYGSMKCEFYQSDFNRVDYCIYPTPIRYEKLFPGLAHGDVSLATNSSMGISSVSNLTAFVQELLYPIDVTSTGNDVDKHMLYCLYASNVWNEVIFQCLCYPDQSLTQTLENIRNNIFQFISLPSLSEVVSWAEDNVNNQHLFRVTVSNGSSENDCYKLLNERGVKTMCSRILFNRTSYMSIYNSIFLSYPQMIPYLEGERFGVPKFHLKTDDENNRALEILINAIAIALIMATAKLVVKPIVKTYKKKISKIKSARKVKQKKAIAEYESIEGKIVDNDETISQLKKELKKNKDMADADKKYILQQIEDLTSANKTLKGLSKDQFNACFKMIKKESLLSKLIPGYASAATMSATMMTALATSSANTVTNGLRIGTILSNQQKSESEKEVEESNLVTEDMLVANSQSQEQAIRDDISKLSDSLSKQIDDNHRASLDEIDTMLINKDIKDSEDRSTQTATITGVLSVMTESIKEIATNSKNPPNYTPKV